MKTPPAEVVPPTSGKPVLSPATTPSSPSRLRALGTHLEALLHAALLPSLVLVPLQYLLVCGRVPAVAATELGALLLQLGLFWLAPLGVAAYVGALLLEPRTSPWRRWFRPWSAAEDAASGRVWWALVPPAMLLWLQLGASLSLRFLQGAGGAPMAYRLVGLWLLAGWALVALIAGAAARWGRGSLWRAAAVGAPLAALIVAAVVVARGPVGGEGSPWAIWGVLHREELDLRLPGLAVLALLAGALISWLRTGGRALRWALAAVVVAGVAVSSRLPVARGTYLAAERHAPPSAGLLKVLRRRADSDRDGFSARWGGGDCDDGDAARSPAADDTPGNGIDEDCSGSDAKPVVVVSRERAAGAPASGWVPPKDLGVLLLTVDALRWDAVGFLGAARKTPALDALAARSTVWERAYALSSYTGKSVPGMLTGRYSSELQRTWEHFARVSPQDTMIQERLQGAGVRTLSVQGFWYFFLKGFGLERGWDLLDNSAAPRGIELQSDTAITSDRMADRTLALLQEQEQRSGSFFLYSHYMDPHYEYRPHEAFAFGKSPRDLYDGEVAFVDQQLGRILSYLEKSPLGQRTVVIISSDHGEAFGEQGMTRHGFELWESLVRVPLLVYYPGQPPRRIAAARSTIDLAPTVAELFGLKVPEGTFSGRSLLSDGLAAGGASAEERPVFLDMAAAPTHTERQVYLEYPWKVVATAGRPIGVYRLDQDPEEKVDLLGQGAEADEMVDRFRAFRRTLRSVPDPAH